MDNKENKIITFSGPFKSITEVEQNKIAGGIVSAVVLGCAVFGYSVGKDLAKKFKPKL